MILGWELEDICNYCGYLHGEERDGDANMTQAVTQVWIANSGLTEDTAVEGSEKELLSPGQFQFNSNSIPNMSPALQTLYHVALVMQSFKTTYWLPNLNNITILDHDFHS